MTQAEILLIAGMTAVTFVPRYVPLLIVGRVRLPDWLLRALRYVPVAVLTAISVPEALTPAGVIDLRISNAALYASIAAVLIAWRFNNLLLTIGGGMAVFIVWRVLFGLG